MNYFDNNPEWKAKADELNAKVVYWHNQCHDAALRGTEVSTALRKALRTANNNLSRHRKAESDRYFKAVNAGLDI